MLEISKFNLILKKNKNVFSDIISDFSIKKINDNIITFVDSNENEIIAEINDSNIIFKFDDKRTTIINLAHDSNSDYVKVIDVIKEERNNGCIIEVLEKYYFNTIQSEDEKVLVDLISNRYVFDEDISTKDISSFEQLCKMKTTFESHFKTLVKPIDSLRWYNASIYSTSTKINGEDISYLYDIVEGNDKIYRIYDLYNGIKNKRNSKDIHAINLGLLRKEAFDYKEISGINAKEREICGDCKNNLLTDECFEHKIYHKV